jgi:hypothetical protein
MEQIECSETSAIINQTPGNHPKEDILYSKHGESLKSRINRLVFLPDPVLSSQVHLGLLSGLFHTIFLTKTLYAPLLSSIRATCPTHPVLLDMLIVPDALRIISYLARDVVCRRANFQYFGWQGGWLIASHYCNFEYWAGIVMLLHWSSACG